MRYIAKSIAHYILALLPLKRLSRSVNNRGQKIDRPFGYRVQREILERAWLQQNKAENAYLRDKFVVHWDKNSLNKSVNSLSIQIIIPTYNSTSDVCNLLTDIRRELLSLDESEQSIFEVLVSDDASENNHWTRIQDQATAYGFKTSRHKKNKGFLRNINSAYSKSNSDFVLLLNSDVRLPKDFFKRILDHVFNDTFALLTIGSYEDFVRFGAKSSSWIQLDAELHSSGARYIEACTAVGYCLLISRNLSPSPLFDENYGHGYGEDSDLHYQVSNTGSQSILSLKMCVLHHGGKSYDQHELADAERSQGMNLFMRRWGERYLLESEFFIPAIESHLESVTSVLSRQKKQIVFAAQGIQSLAIGGSEVIRTAIAEMVSDGLELIVSDLDGATGPIISGAVRAIPKSHLVTHLKSSSISHLIVGGIAGAKYIDELRDSGVKPDRVFVLLQGPDNLMDPGFSDSFINSIASADVVFVNSEYMARVGKFFGARRIESFTPEQWTNSVKTSIVKIKKTKYDLCLSLRHEHGKAPWLSVAVGNYFAKLGWSVAVFGNASEDYHHQLNEKISRLGVMTPKRLNELFQQTKVFFDSSLYEGYGLLSREAVNAGCRVVAIENGGNETEAKKDVFELVAAWDMVSIFEKISFAKSQKNTLTMLAKKPSKSLSQALSHQIQISRDA